MKDPTIPETKKEWFDDWSIKQDSNGKLEVSLPHSHTNTLHGRVKFRKVSDARVLWLVSALDAALTELSTQAQLHDQEMRELLKDKERLDFLDRCNQVLNKQSGTVYGWELITNHNVNRLIREKHLNDIDLNDAKANGAKSCRNAIDEKIESLTTTTSERKAE